MSTIDFKTAAQTDPVTPIPKPIVEQTSSAHVSNLMKNADYGVICKQPDYDVNVEREKTHGKPIGVGRHVVIISCFDPRNDVASELVFKHINYAGLCLQVRVAGGRAIDALRSLVVSHYMFQIEVIAVVHHTFCGCTSFTLPTIRKALMDEDGIHVDERTLSTEHLDALTIDNLRQSVKDDVRLIEERVAGRKTKVLGFVYDIVTGELTEVSLT